MLRRVKCLRGPTGGAFRTIVDAGAMPRPKADPYTRGRQAVVLNELMSLPVDERTTIELMYFRGLSRRQIAERLDVPLSEIDVGPPPDSKTRAVAPRLRPLVRTSRYGCTMPQPRIRASR